MVKPLEANTIDDLQTLQYYIDYFTNQVGSKYRKSDRCFDPADLQQEAAIYIIKAYPRVKGLLESGQKFNILAYFGNIVTKRLLTFQVDNQFVVRTKTYAAYSRNKELFNERFRYPFDITGVETYMVPASGLINFTDSIDLRLDIEDFASRFDQLGIIAMRLQGYKLTEIAKKLGMPYREIVKRNNRVKDRLTEFLAQ